MSNEELISKGNELVERMEKLMEGKPPEHLSARVEGAQFLKDYAGKDSSFYQELSATRHHGGDAEYMSCVAKSSVEAFLRYLLNGLTNKVSPKREAQIEVVGDILEQANQLLQDNKVHPAAPAVLIGAALEEFLRNWVEASGTNSGSIKPGIDAYAKLLRENELISKQEKKDIDAWAGNRNNAAHGHWDDVNSRQLINIMLQGVNFFISKHTA